MKNFLLVIVFIFILPTQAQRIDFTEIDFTKAERIANRYKGEDLTNVPILAHRLSTPLETEVERFRAIYYWVCHNIKGDYDLMSKNERKRRKYKDRPQALAQWNSQFKKEVFTQLVRRKKTLCTGYAYLIKELANKAGLECEIVYGFDNNLKSDANGPNHSWNAVKLNGKWYLCDATWSSGYTDMSTFLFEFEYDNRYFLMDPIEFAKSHTPTDKKWTLLPDNSQVVSQ